MDSEEIRSAPKSHHRHIYILFTRLIIRLACCSGRRHDGWTDRSSAALLLNAECHKRGANRGSSQLYGLVRGVSTYVRWCFVLSVGLYLLRHYLNGSPYLALLLCSSWMHHLDPGTFWQLLQVQIFMGGKESIYKEKCWSHLCTLFIGRGCLRYACPPYRGCVYLCKYIFDNIELNVMTRIEEELLALVMPC